MPVAVGMAIGLAVPLGLAAGLILGLALGQPLLGLFVGTTLTVLYRLIPDDTCARCGYSLEGLGASRVCPECGQPVDEGREGMLEQTGALGRA
jgi:hypothetical protein